MKLSCRTCRKPLPEPLGALGPFCSERCRLVDLGAWADGSYHVPGEPLSSEDEVSDEIAPERAKRLKTAH